MKTVAKRGVTYAGARAFAPLALLGPLAFVLVACGGPPKIDGVSLPPAQANQPATPYRDLADIPAAPSVTSTETNQGTIQTLTEDRAKTAQAAENLRRQPFDQPDPATQSGF